VTSKRRAAASTAAIIALQLLLQIATVSAEEPDRAKALALAQQGHPELAFPIYDALTEKAPTDAQIYQEAIAAATRARDFHRAALYGERQLAVDPGNFNAMERSAFSYHMAGDTPGYQRARDRAFQYRLATNDPKLQSNRLMMDVFTVGNLNIFSNECYKSAAPLRIRYRFDVQERLPDPPGGQTLRSYIVIESAERDEQVTAEMTGDKRQYFTSTPSRTAGRYIRRSSSMSANRPTRSRRRGSYSICRIGKRCRLRPHRTGGHSRPIAARYSVRPECRKLTAL
jgi:hypothetical protein